MNSSSFISLTNAREEMTAVSLLLIIYLWISLRCEEGKLNRRKE